jgi:hypothetical protein
LNDSNSFLLVINDFSCLVVVIMKKLFIALAIAGLYGTSFSANALQNDVYNNNPSHSSAPCIFHHLPNNHISRPL